MSQGSNPQTEPSTGFVTDGGNQAAETRQTQGPVGKEANTDATTSVDSALQATNVKVVKASDDSNMEVL